MTDNPFQSPDAIKRSPTGRVFERPMPGGWRPGLLFSAVPLVSLAELAMATLLF
jgi:hypothetical protein